MFGRLFAFIEPFVLVNALSFQHQQSTPLVLNAGSFGSGAGSTKEQHQKHKNKKGSFSHDQKLMSRYSMISECSSRFYVKVAPGVSSEVKSLSFYLLNYRHEKDTIIGTWRNDVGILYGLLDRIK